MAALNLLTYARLTADALAGLPAAAGVVEGFAGRLQVDGHGGPHGTTTIQPCQVTTTPHLTPPLPYPWPLPWTRLSSMLRPVHLQAWQMRNCAGDFCSHPLEHCTVGLVQCSKAPCCTLSNVPKALPLEGVCVHVCVSYSSLAQVA